MDTETQRRYGDELFEALQRRQVVAPLTEREPDISIDDAYHISRRLFERRLAAGERLIGKKIGVTSKAVQNMLNVHQPDFGYLTDAMRFESGAPMPISQRLIQPRAEGEIAFILKHDLQGPLAGEAGDAVTPAQVVAATASIHPCFEIVDSRVRDWKIKIQDTISDNASSGLFVMGEGRSAVDFDFFSCGMVVEKNGAVISTGAGAAALDSPLNCVAWLANTLGAYGIGLKAGEVILSGSLVPLEPVVAGDHMRVSIAGLGRAEVFFE